MVHFETINNSSEHSIMLVHGFTQNRTVFYPLINFFREKFNFILIDLRGHGKSENIEGPYGIEEYTDDIQRVIEKNNLTSIIYWGTHTGAAVGLNLYFRIKEVISCLILEGVVIPGFETPGINSCIQRAKKLTVEKGLEFARNDWVNNAQWFSYMKNNPAETGYFKHVEIINNFSGKPWKTELKPRATTDIYSRLADIKIPVLVYNGEYDMDEFIIMADEIEKKACIERVTINNAGGFPCWENPLQVSGKVTGFLKNIYRI